ncbi:MAG: 1,4-alpha-glucan branching protein GlgB, partial [Parachlamydiaceae bacterium]
MLYNNLIKGLEYNPHSVLGLHKGSVIVWRPQAKEVFIELKGKVIPLDKVEEGVFQKKVGEEVGPLDYRIYHTDGSIGYDPYAFLPTLGEVDLYLFAKGVHYQLYNVLGARSIIHQGVEGVKFAVWAPGAKCVSLVGDFNYWDGRVNPMRVLGSSGVWEIFIPGLKEGSRYKFEIKAQNETLLIKSDPMALGGEFRPNTASVVRSVDRIEWEDRSWMENRAKRYLEQRPISIYELHLGSWKTNEGHFFNYRELGVKIADYAKEMGFTHIELMPIQEHPLDESWGYQVSGFYAVTSRYGTPEDFQWMVNYLHLKGIGVILDWVPGHFPVDEFSLKSFDGTCLYEHEDPRQGFHPHWNTCLFNMSRHEVSNFLLANALFWFDKMHVDGLRVDAVASMLYLNYGRSEGEWIPNRFGGVDNLESIEFFKHLNSVTHRMFPGILMIAEESTAYPGITHPVEAGGLGFDLKWNMGWMNDTLRYFKIDPLFRSYHQNELTFSMIYAFSERFCLPFSHDEVVHMKGSLLSRMPGDVWQKFANLRLLHSYQYCHPGKKLLFMGGEIGQWNEWNAKREIEWFLLDFPAQKGIQNLVKYLNL